MEHWFYSCDIAKADIAPDQSRYVQTLFPTPFPEDAQSKPALPEQSLEISPPGEVSPVSRSLALADSLSLFRAVKMRKRLMETEQGWFPCQMLLLSSRIS